MTESINHYEEALDHLDKAEDALDTWSATVHLKVAHTHAQLALVEQQRIANLIALAKPMKVLGEGDMEVSVPVVEIAPEKGGMRSVRIKPDIAAALGLEETK